MGNAFSTDPYAKSYYTKSKAPTHQQQLDYEHKQISNARKMLANISQGKLPTSNQLSAINFQRGRVCQLGNCDNRRVPKAAVLALYKRGAENFIKARQQKIVTISKNHRQPRRKVIQI